MKWIQIKALHAVLLTGAALLLGACATTQPAAVQPAAASATEQPKTVLWVGNSFYYFNNGMLGHVG